MNACCYFFYKKVLSPLSLCIDFGTHLVVGRAHAAHSQARLRVGLILLNRGRCLPIEHRAAHVLKVGLHRQWQPKAFGEKVLRRNLHGTHETAKQPRANHALCRG